MAKKIIKQNIVNDYFTPSVKSEVILSSLLTPYIHKIINIQLDLQTRFVGKEMPFRSADDKNNGGSKIDFLVADADWVYMTELKTTCNVNKAQENKYINSISKYKNFGDNIGWKLLNIIVDVFDLKIARKFEERTFREIYNLIYYKYRKSEIETNFAEKALEIIKDQKWAQSASTRNHSRKYLYSLGQILDYLESGNEIFEKELKLLYLTPLDDKNMSNNINITDGINIVNSVIVNSVEDNEYTRFLCDVFNKIFLD